MATDAEFDGIERKWRVAHMLDNQDNYNVAAMHKALVTIRERLVATYASESEFMQLSPNKPLIDLIDAALSKPPRNCDRFCSIEQAKAAYCEEVRNVFIWDGDESGRFEKWFLAPTKQKGENQ